MELIEREDIPSGIYNVADDKPLSTKKLIGLIAQSQNRNQKLWNISKKFIEGAASLGDKLHLPLNSERLQKLTSSYVVSNAKIKAAIGKSLPVSSREGLFKTFQSFHSISTRILCLPLFFELTDVDIELISRIILRNLNYLTVLLIINIIYESCNFSRWARNTTS